MTEREHSREDREFQRRVASLGRSFDVWWSNQPSEILNMDTVGEIVAHIWVQIRQFLPEHDAQRLMDFVIDAAERHIQSGDIQLSTNQGEVFTYRSAEEYEGREELRDMLLEALHGTAPTDEDLEKFLDGMD